MAKSRLRPKRKKYFQKPKKLWLFDKKSNILLVLFGIFLSVMAILSLIGVFVKYYKLISK